MAPGPIPSLEEGNDCAQTTSTQTISFRSSERVSGGWFYSGMAIAAILTSIAGFTPSLISTAGRNAPVTSMAAAHGVISSAWLLVFLAQTMLIRTGRITAHRSLGTASAVLAAAMIALGYVTSIAMARRGFDLSGDLAVRPDPLASLGFPLLDTLMFAVLFVAGVVYRRQPAIHKRLMLLAVAAALMPAPLAHLSGHSPFLRSLVRWR